MGVALITGAGGQDGWHLARLLLDRGDEVWGLSRAAALPAGLERVRPLLATDVRDAAALEEALTLAKPDEIYHLAAASAVVASWRDPVAAAEIVGLGTARLLKAARRIAPAARIFVASSSEVFGAPDVSPQDGATPFRPTSPYGAAKAHAHQLAHVYRDGYGLFVAAGILYNHESPRRPPSFVSRKIAAGAVAIARGEQSELRLGNLGAKRDWGYAPDYARAVPLMLGQPEPGDYVIATGRAHTVADWCERAFARVGLDWREHVVVDPAFWRPAEAVPLAGDATRARRELGWSPSVGFDALVDLMVDAELDGTASPCSP